MPDDEELKEILTEIDKELIIIMQKRHNLRQLRKDIEMVQAKATNSVIDLTPIRAQMIQKIKSKAEELRVKKDA